MFKIVLLTAVLALYGAFGFINSQELEVYSLKTRVEAAGLAFETHKVVTNDGYTLQVFRIYAPDRERFFMNVSAFPVLMWHGLFNDAGSFILAHGDD